MQKIDVIAEPETRTLVQQVAAVLGVALGYYVCCFVGTVLSVPPSGYAIIWPATAFLVGVLLLTPVRYWWTYLLGVVPAHLLLVDVFQHPPTPPLLAAFQIAGNAALATINALAVRRTNRGPLRFDSFRNMLVFIVVASLAIPSLVNAVALSLQLAAGWTQDLWLAWRQWMLGSIFPTVTLTPLMVLAAGRGFAVARLSRAEALGLSLALFGLTYLAFGQSAEAAYLPELLLIPLPIMLWAAVRWGPAGASLSLLLFAAAIIVRALNGVGPFAAHASAVSVLSLQVYLTAISLALMLLAALSEEQRRGVAQLRRSELRMEIVAASTDTGLWQWDVAGERLWTTEHCRSMFGLAAAEALTPQAFLGAVEPDDRLVVSRVLAEGLMIADARSMREFRVRRRDGAERWFVMRTHAEFDAARRPVRVSGVFRDITPTVAAQQQAEQASRRLLTLQEDERKAIAEALHDTTTQHLVAAGLTVGMLERRIEVTAEARALLDDIRGQLATATNELRAFTYLLRPPELEAQGLVPVLRRYVDGFGLRTGIRTSTRLSADADQLPIEHQRALLRIVQESLANVYRHAAASRVTVSLRRHADHLHLIVRDDGHGILAGAGEDAEPARLGVGIPGMSNRIRQLGGKFDIRSGPRGATVHAALPIVS